MTAGTDRGVRCISMQISRPNVKWIATVVVAGILTDRSLKSDEIHPNTRGYAPLLEEANERR
jgi:hypothetical protein